MRVVSHLFYKLKCRGNAHTVRVSGVGMTPPAAVVLVSASDRTLSFTQFSYHSYTNTIKEKYPDKKIVIILDNARYNYAIITRDFAKENNIKLLFLPPYAPNLNLIERLWKFTNKHWMM